MDTGGWGNREDVMSSEKCKEFSVVPAVWHDKDRELIGEHTVKTVFELYPCNYLSSFS